MDQPSGSEAVPPELARAEELVDDLTETVSAWATRAGRGILKRAALAREEAEDIWAEARSLNQGEHR